MHKLWLTYLKEYLKVDKTNKLELHLSIWINFNIIVNENAICKIRYIYVWYNAIYVHFKNKNMLFLDVCTRSRSIKTCMGEIRTMFAVVLRDGDVYFVP